MRNAGPFPLASSCPQEDVAAVGLHPATGALLCPGAGCGHARGNGRRNPLFSWRKTPTSSRHALTVMSCTKKSPGRPVRASLLTTHRTVPPGTGAAPAPRPPHPQHTLLALPGMKDRKMHPRCPPRAGTSGLGCSGSGPTVGAAADRTHSDPARPTPGRKPGSPSPPRDGVLIPRSVSTKILKAFGKATRRRRGLDNGTHEEPASESGGSVREREDGGRTG